MDQVQQAYHLRPDGHNEQQVSEQTKTSKTQAQEENRLKTQEGQMIKVSPHGFSSFSPRPSSSRVEHLFNRYLLFAGFKEDEL